MIDARFRPMAAPKYRHRRAAPFRSTWPKTLDLLEKELTYLGAKEIIVQAGFELPEIRNDGWPRGGRRPTHPAVVISFRDRNGQPLSFPCDTYGDYEDNIRAIALSLEALRAVNRYGVTKGTEQYQGFAQISAPDPDAARTEALVFLSRVTEWTQTQIISDQRGAYRLACASCHPDSGGSHEKFVQLQQHWEVLNR